MSNYKKILLVILCTMRTSILNAEDVELKDVSPTKSIAAHVQLKLNECKTKLDLATNSLKASTPDLQDVAKKLTEVTNILCKDISLEILEKLKHERGDIQAQIDEIQKKIKGQNNILQALLKEKQEQLEKTQKDTLEVLNSTIYQELATGYTKDRKSVTPVITQNIQSWDDVKKNFPNTETSDQIKKLTYDNLQKLAESSNTYSWIFEGKIKKNKFDSAIKKAVEYCYKLVAILKTLKVFEKDESKKQNIQTIINGLEQEYMAKLKTMQWPTPMIQRKNLSWPDPTQSTNFENFKKAISNIFTFINQFQDPFLSVQELADSLKQK